MSLLQLKKSLMKRIKPFYILVGIILLSYPFIVFIALQQHISLRLMAFFLLGMALLNFVQTKQKLILLLICILSCLLFCFNNALFLKLYPVLMNALVGFSFAFSLYKTPLITVFAQKIGHTLSPKAIEYTRKATIAWTFFIFFNMFLSLTTVFMSDFVWSLYNGFISYLLIGMMFMGEYIVRKRRQHVN